MRLAFSGRKTEKDGSVRNELNLQSIGMYRIEDGINDQMSWERWDLKIANPSYGWPFKGIYCELSRTRFTKGLMGEDDTDVFIDTYTNTDSDKSIIIDREDWNAGVIDLRVDWGMGKGTWYYADGNQPLNIEIRFKQDYLMPDMPVAFSNLQSIRATSAVRDFTGEKKLHIVEYKLIDYDQVVMVPVKMRGVKESGMKKWNEMIASLSQEDRSAWEELKKDRKVL